MADLLGDELFALDRLTIALVVDRPGVALGDEVVALGGTVGITVDLVWPDRKEGL